MSTRRRLASLAAPLAIWTASVPALLACPVCFQVEQGPVTSGVRAGVVVLLGVTIGVLSGFGAFTGRFVRRARRPDPLRTASDQIKKRTGP